MRGSLPNDKLEEISKRLPRVDRRLLALTAQGPAIDLHDLIENKQLGVAFVCLDDARQRFGDVVYALHEAYACIIWYREFAVDPPKEMEAVFTAKFYVDYAALLLYAAAEDISFFITHFLDIETELTNFLKEAKTIRQLEKKKISSNAAKVGIYLKEKYQDHELTKVVLALHRDIHWQATLDYRNTWVHDKPPIVQGTGIEYRRHTRVKSTEKGTRSIGFGGGAPHQYNIDELLAQVHLAANAYENALSALIPILLKMRRRLGERTDVEEYGQ